MASTVCVTCSRNIAKLADSPVAVSTECIRAARLALAFGLAGAASAQQEVASQARGGLEDIVVTAQKRGVAERAIAITTLNAEAIQQQNVRDLSSLTTSILNVSLESSAS